MTIKFNANKSLIHESNVRAIAYSLPTRGNFLSCTSSSLLQSMDITYLCSRIVTLGIGKRGYFFLRCSLVRGQALCSVVRALYFRLIGGIYNVLLWHYLTEPLNKPRNLCHDKTTINFILDWNTFFVRAHGLGRTQINQIHQIDLSLSWSMLPISPTVGEQVSTRYSIPYGWLFLGPLQIVQSFRHLMLPFVDFSIILLSTLITSSSLPPDHSRRYRSGHERRVCFVTRHWGQVPQDLSQIFAPYPKI